MNAVLIQVGKSPMQSGLAKKDDWMLKFIASEKIWFEYNQVHWSGSSSTIKQRQMLFAEKKEAIAFCKKHNIQFAEVVQNSKRIVPKSYTETIINS